MKFISLLALLLVASAAIADDSSEEELTLAEECTADTVCELPDCRCMSTNIPGGLLPRDTPQFVTVTFDDAITINNVITYRDTLYNRVNSNGCPVGATFFVNHEYTNYVIVNELYNQGFEIALHSISHQTPQTYWLEATKEDMRREFGDQKIQMAHFANIPYESIKGLRIPFLQMAGNASFAIMNEYGLEYDCTQPTISFTDPGLWPYTLDYASTQDCIIPPCPTASFPGIWVKPMVAWMDLEGVPCSFVDICYFVPDRDNEDEWYEFIVGNFERHYLGTRAPFGFFIHEAYLSAFPAIQRALVRFMDLVNKLPDAFMVNAHEVIDWVKNPVPINEYKAQPCRSFTPTTCTPSSCGPLSSNHNEWPLNYWMQICNVCPRVYPWLDNPLGL